MSRSDGSTSQARQVPPELRRAELMRFLSRHGGATLGELVRYLNVSPVTIHRDLDRLAREGRGERVQGGARLAGSDTVISHWALRLGQHSAEKRSIAAHAARLVAPGSTIFVDSSSTALAFAEALALRPGLGVTLVTNSPAISYRIEAPSIHVVVTPGELQQELKTIGGHWAVEFLRTLKFNTAFISGASINREQGLGTMTGVLAEVLNAARSVADETVALVDSSKFERTSLLQVAPLADLTTVITDEQLPATVREAYEAAGTRVVLAQASSAPAPLVGTESG